MEQFLNTETLVIALLLIASVVAIAVRRLRVPYTVALVIAGLLITSQRPVGIEITPELILMLFVPPLVFEAAFHLDLDLLRANLIPILVFSVPGVLLTMAIVGLVVAIGVNLPLTTALVFGALISATDPVAVVALFRALGMPRRLAAIVEGESLFNDGTSIVVFNLVLVAALQAAGISVQQDGSILVNFLLVSLGGFGIGVALGWVISQVIARLDDYLIETTLTTVLAFGAYLVADRLHFSGVLAVVGAGIVNGNIGPKGMSPTTRVVLFNFWEYLAFIANSLVFLLIGLQVNLPQIVANVGPIAIAVVAVLVARASAVYGLTALMNIRGRPIPHAHQHVLFWSGLRGAISLALALSLPATLPQRDLLRVMAFGVVLFTLLGQGTTMQLLLQRLGLVKHDESDLEYQRRHGRLIAARAARDRLQQLHLSGLLSATTWEQLAPALDAQVQACLDAQRVLLREHPVLQAEELDDARREGLLAQRASLADLLHDGILSERIYEELVTAVDAALVETNPAAQPADSAGTQPVDPLDGEAQTAPR